MKAALGKVAGMARGGAKFVAGKGRALRGRVRAMTRRKKIIGGVALTGTAALGGVGGGKLYRARKGRTQYK